MKAKVIAIAQRKGGTGKTTTAAAIAAGLLRQGRKVLLIDSDAQCNLSFSYKVYNDGGPTIYDAITYNTTAEETVRHTESGMDIIPASVAMATADMTVKGKGMEYRLKEVITPLTAQYEYIIIDTPPALSIVTVNALTAAHKVLITAQADFYNIMALQDIGKTIKSVTEHSNPDLKITGVLLTKYNSRQVLSRDSAELLAKAAAQIGATILETKIRESVALREAAAMQQDIFTYAPRSNGAADYSALINELARYKKL